MKRVMLTENDVVDAVAAHLEADGWRIDERCYTTERGNDILATKGETTLAVEAKGGLAVKPRGESSQDGFTPAQRLSHVSRALYKVAFVVSAGEHQAALAVPSDAGHRKLIDDIAPALAALKVAVFLVNDDFAVETYASLPGVITGYRGDGS